MSANDFAMNYVRQAISCDDSAKQRGPAMRHEKNKEEKMESAAKAGTGESTSDAMFTNIVRSVAVGLLSNPLLLRSVATRDSLASMSSDAASYILDHASFREAFEAHKTAMDVFSKLTVHATAVRREEKRLADIAAWWERTRELTQTLMETLPSHYLRALRAAAAPSLRAIWCNAPAEQAYMFSRPNKSEWKHDAIERDGIERFETACGKRFSYHELYFSLENPATSRVLSYDSDTNECTLTVSDVLLAKPVLDEDLIAHEPSDADLFVPFTRALANALHVLRVIAAARLNEQLHDRCFKGSVFTELTKVMPTMDAGNNVSFVLDMDYPRKKDIRVTGVTMNVFAQWE